MQEYIGCDAHKKYSVFVCITEAGEVKAPVRVKHEKEAYRNFLYTLPAGSKIAVETVGNWYWMIDAMEQAGHKPQLTHAVKAKLMMGQVNKTDPLDAKGLAVLLRNGTLPSVFIPSPELRDERELPRMRMALVKIRTHMKNRVHATLSKYAIDIDEVSDVFGVKGRELLTQRLSELPPYTCQSVERQLQVLDHVIEQITECEKQIEGVVKETKEMSLLKTLPGVGSILATVLALEIGPVERFADAPRLASYAGTTPRVHSSGGKTFYGPVRHDVNRYLKWALVEAANCTVLQKERMKDRHVGRLYRRIRARKGHAKAVVAVARHLAEAAFWVLKKQEPYKEPKGSLSVSLTQT